MWPDSTFISMLVLALVLFVLLFWPIGVDLYALWVKRRLQKRIQQESQAWVERRKQFAREALR